MSNNKELNAKTYYDKGLEYLEIGDYKEARKALKEALNSNPTQDIEKKIQEKLESLSFDNIYYYVIFGTVGLLGLLYIYFKFIHH